MTLEEKVGQLFVMRVYGQLGDRPDQADIAANLAEIGVRMAAELIATYHVGGIIYFAWAHNTRDPRQIVDLSNGIQKAGRPSAPPTCSSRPTRSTASSPGSASDAPARRDGPRGGRPRTTPAKPPESPVRSCARWA